MKITKKEVGYIAHLARLDFSEDEKGKLTSQLNTILMYMDMLNRVDTARIQPATHAVSLDNVFRDDIEKKSTGVEIALANAPDGTMGLFGVPRVID
ncbi:MAG: Asp-tRNA(Asn)/Glu-tRNA(Gln) amidotransferase subunit GatC [Deltaproteobacteria bacterium]|nr:Asp-tRNA(Asn)/Glu-tRNA(Gln) amidotransferase subunit GatC [Deltaproteobacteria bacterium]MBW2594933.1 Asp-tRNA(Asn)/Glu-tRNA(Gln) amidotransferase subunit GatC [Deltaproteobacteria bacterium]